MSEGCPFCGKEQSNRVCVSCAEATYLDGVFAMCAYAHPAVRKAIGVWKYHGDKAMQEVIVRWIRQALASVQMLQRPFAVAPLPLHASRRRQRGFDQAAIIAQTVARVFGEESQEVLRRRTWTASQAQQTHERRQIGMLDGIFEVIGPVPQRMVLCDDVFTSGATMDAAARALKEAGALEVWGFTVAKG